jgi:DNA-binding NtrC family response regulator
MRDVARTVEHVATSDLSVLIVGESGTGKEWLARRIHLLSRHSASPFVPVACSVLTSGNVEPEIFGTLPSTNGDSEVFPGAFERAKGGTVFFDEVSTLPPPAQMKLAGILETRVMHHPGLALDMRIDARVIATLDRKPETLVAEGTLRKDLFYRISPIIIEMPPLRKRKDDIPLLIEKLLMESNDRHGCSVIGMNAEALKRCIAYEWPGNVRELRNAVDYAVLMCRDSVIVPEFLPYYVTFIDQPVQTIDVQRDMNVASVEKLLIEQALNESRTKKQAAKRLGISLKTLYNKLNRYNLYDKFVNYSRPRVVEDPEKDFQPQAAAALGIAPQLIDNGDATFPTIPAQVRKGTAS